ncbi:hypothetical protein OIU85_022747 [Salix viminalis]|uniref:Uncharacterized protein n=1 Tax=Salix viminalis TaxID=40686 RepID=A0A9Q0Z855_SALVM|nr:hypothetical protein OIU85_022747 [Salix viminalis]
MFPSSRPPWKQKLTGSTLLDIKCDLQIEIQLPPDLVSGCCATSHIYILPPPGWVRHGRRWGGFGMAAASRFIIKH